VSDNGLREIARFLSERPPFDALAPEELGEIARHSTIEFHPAGAAILTEDGGPVTFLRVVHSGAVDIAHDGRLLDLLGPGDTFGHAAMLSGLPPGFEARAAEDTLCYRIPVAAARPLLDRARDRELSVGAREPAHRPVAELIRSATVTCAPADPVADVAHRMTRAGASCAIVERPDGARAILTDSDLRTRVLAAGRPPHTPVGEVSSEPLFAVAAGQLAGEVLHEMLSRGVRHAPVISERGRLVGVVEDGDLFAASPHSWFAARRTIERAESLARLAEVRRTLPGLVLDLYGAGLRAPEIARVLSALTDALIARALDLAGAEQGVWVAVGSLARRELTVASTPRGAFVAAQTAAGLAALGVRPAEDPIELLTDRRAVWGTPVDPLPLLVGGLDELRRRALAHSAPTGFGAGAVLAGAGTPDERLDIRTSVIVPIVEIARWTGARAGVPTGSTTERLASLGDSSLAEAFALAGELRLAHHIQQLSAGHRPDDLLDPTALSPLSRGHLRDVFRAISAQQRAMAR
jgi:CBS domain-containing protein